MKSRGLSPLHRPRRRAAARLFLQGRNWLPLLPPPALPVADNPPPVAGPGQPPDVAPMPPPGLLVMGLPARRPDADTSCKRAMTRAPLVIVISAPLAIESRKRIKISEREETLENFQ